MSDIISHKFVQKRPMHFQWARECSPMVDEFVEWLEGSEMRIQVNQELRNGCLLMLLVSATTNYDHLRNLITSALVLKLPMIVFKSEGTPFPSEMEYVFKDAITVDCSGGYTVELRDEVVHILLKAGILEYEPILPVRPLP